MRLSLLFSILLCTLTLAHAEEQEPTKILITGSFSPIGMQRVGKPIDVVDQAELDKDTSGNLGEALEQVPGVSSSSFGPGASRPIVRGLGKSRVRVLENGLEVGDVSSVSDDHAVALDPLTVDRIDVLRGASTLMYGSQAIGGVVNVIDGSIKEEPIGKELTGKLRLNLGDSANDEEAGALVLEGEQRGWNWHVSGFSRESSDIEIPTAAESERLRELEELEHEEDHDLHDAHHEEHSDESEDSLKLANSDTKSTGVKFGISRAFKDGFIGVAVRRSDSKYGIPGGHSHGLDEHEHEHEHEHDHEREIHADEHDEEELARIDAELTKIESRGAIHLHEENLDSLRFGISHSNYMHDELEGDEVGTRYDRSTTEARLVLTHVHQDLLEGGIGFQLNHEDLEVSGSEAFLPNSDVITPALFVVEDFKIDRNWVWQLGGRYEFSRIVPEFHEEESFHSVSSSTGVTWHSNERNYNAALTFSYSERAPNATELFADGIHVANQSYERGDNDLSEERSFGTELIFRKLTGSVRGSVGFFFNNFENFISLESDGTEIEGFPVFLYEGVDAQLWGLEADLEVDLLKQGSHTVMFSSGYDQVRGINRSNDTSLPRITPRRLRVGLTHNYDAFSSDVEASFVNQQDRVAPFELPTDEYYLLSAGVSYTLSGVADKYGVNRSIEFFVRGTNLTDQEARVHTSFLKDQAPLRGRAFFAGLTAYF